MMRLGGAYLQVSLTITKNGAQLLMGVKKYQYNRALVQGAQWVHLAVAKIGRPACEYTHVQKYQRCYGYLIYEVCN